MVSSTRTENGEQHREIGDVPALVESILADAVSAGASDVHVEPLKDRFEIRLRVDGMLSTVATQPTETGRLIVSRLMVLARLLTYRPEIPQEGRATIDLAGHRSIELRVATVPTTHGLRAAVRLPAELIAPRTMAELGLSAPAMAGLRAFATADSGMLLVVGPAGSGKTSTLYALLSHIAELDRGLSIVALEDPVERDLAGVTQIEVSTLGPMTYERALRSMLRQDPQVLMLGEIRDAATASLAVQAALSGHRLCSTLHAASPAGALARLLEMGVEPYQLASSVVGILSQRLLRRRSGNGYRGRLPVAEFATINAVARAALLRRAEAEELATCLATAAGYQTLAENAAQLVTVGQTDDAEVDRVLGAARAAAERDPS